MTPTKTLLWGNSKAKTVFRSALKQQSGWCNISICFSSFIDFFPSIYKLVFKVEPTDVSKFFDQIENDRQVFCGWSLELYLVWIWNCFVKLMQFGIRGKISNFLKSHFNRWRRLDDLISWIRSILALFRLSLWIAAHENKIIVPKQTILSNKNRPLMCK